MVNGIRNELAALRDTMVFGRWDPGLDFEQLDLSKAATKLWSEAPVFTYLITELAQNQCGVDNAYQRHENTGYVVMITSIILLTDARFIPSGKWHKAPGNCSPTWSGSH